MIALAGCGEPMAPPLVSGQTPPGTGNVNAASQPQPLNSLPPGAEGLGRGMIQPTYLSRTFSL